MALVDSAGTQTLDHRMAPPPAAPSGRPPRLQCRVSLDVRHPLYGVLAALPAAHRAAVLLGMAERGAALEAATDRGAARVEPVPVASPPAATANGAPAAGSADADLAAAVLRLAEAVDRLSAGMGTGVGSPVARASDTGIGAGDTDAAARAAQLDGAWGA
jgi:hypothetical protein